MLMSVIGVSILNKLLLFQFLFAWLMNGNLKTYCMLHEEYNLLSVNIVLILSLCVSCILYCIILYILYFLVAVNITLALLFKITLVLKCFKVSLIIW